MTIGSTLDVGGSPCETPQQPLVSPQAAPAQNTEPPPVVATEPTAPPPPPPVAVGTWATFVDEVFNSHGFPRLQQWLADGAQVYDRPIPGAPPRPNDVVLLNAFDNEGSNAAQELRGRHAGSGGDKRGSLPRRVLFRLLLAVDVTLRGISQVYVVDNPLSAVLMLLAVALTSPWFLLYSVFGSLCGNLGALYVLRRVNENCLIGLFGYDATLVGNAAMTFIDGGGTAKVFFITMFACFFAGMARCSVGMVLSAAKLPTLTLTFCSVTTLYLNCVGRGFAGLSLSKAPLPSFGSGYGAAFWFEGSFRGIGQVIFADTFAGGILVFLAIGLYSRLGALYSLIGGFIGTFFGVYLSSGVASYTAVRYGLHSYNPALTALALGIQVLLPFNGILDYALPIFGALFSVVGQVAYISILGGAPYHTFPFVFTLFFIFPAIVHNEDRQVKQSASADVVPATAAAPAAAAAATAGPLTVRQTAGAHSTPESGMQRCDVQSFSHDGDDELGGVEMEARAFVGGRSPGGSPSSGFLSRPPPPRVGSLCATSVCVTPHTADHHE